MDESTGDLILLSKKSGEVMFRIEKEYWMHKVEGDAEELKKIYEFVYVDSDGNVWIPNYLVKGPKEIIKPIIDPTKLKHVVLIVHESKEDLIGKNVLKYIEWGEQRGYSTRDQCSSRKYWYDLGTEIIANLVWIKSVNETHLTAYSLQYLFTDQRVYAIKVKNKYSPFVSVLAGIMNSTLYYLLKEIYGRVNLGEGALDTAVYEIQKYPIIDPSKLSLDCVEKLSKVITTISSRKIGTVFEEIGANSPEDVSLDKVKPDRRELDKIVMGEILGLTEEEQLEVYRAVIDLVKSRIERAKSVRKKKKEGVDVEEVAKNIVERIQKLNLVKKFPDDYIDVTQIDEIEEEIKVKKKGKVTLTSELTGYNVKISEEEVYSTDDQFKAKFVYYSLLSGKKVVQIPADEKLLKMAIEKFEQDRKALKDYMNKMLEAWVPDKKIRKEVEKEVVKMLERLI